MDGLLVSSGIFIVASHEHRSATAGAMELFASAASARPIRLMSLRAMPFTVQTIYVPSAITICAGRKCHRTATSV